MSLKVEAEVKVDSDACLVAWDKRLFVGFEDGSIKSYDESLAPGVSWAAHGVQLFSLAAGEGRVYSTSNDGGVRVWSPDGQKIEELAATGADIGTLHIEGKELYAGDEAGNIIVYENNKEKAMYNVMEEVKGIGVSRPYLFTVRDLDVTVTEIKPDESKCRFVTRHTMEGRAPLRVVGTRLLVMARGGNVLQLIDNSVGTSFKKLHEIKVSDMIVTSLSVAGDMVWTGSWDGHVRRWKMSGDKLEPAGELNLGACINALVATVPDNAYVALAGGKILRVKCF